MTLSDRCPYYATDPYWTSRSRDDNWRCGQIRNHLRAGHVLYSSDGDRILDQSVTGWEKRGEHARPYDPVSERGRLMRWDTMGPNAKHWNIDHATLTGIYADNHVSREQRLAALDASVHE